MYADEGFLCVTVGMGTDRAARPASVRIRIRVRVGVKVKAGLQTRQEDLLSHCFWQFDNVDFVRDPVRPMPSLFFSHAPARLPDHPAINANSNGKQKQAPTTRNCFAGVDRPNVQSPMTDSFKQLSMVPNPNAKPGPGVRG